MFVPPFDSILHPGIGSALWQKIRQHGVTTLSVMGMTRHTGKTVCLNHLIASADAADVAVGITAPARSPADGVAAVPRPRVRVWPGCLLATARDTLRQTTVRWKHLGGAYIASPLGPVLIVRALDYGELDVAGAANGDDQQTVISQLKQCGASLVIVDGAIDHGHHLVPSAAEGLVLTTGAAIGGGIAEVIRKTHDKLAVLDIAEAGNVLAAQVQPIFDHGGIGVWNHAGRCVFDARIAMVNAAAVLLDLVVDDMACIAVSGEVGPPLWRAVMARLARHPGLTLVVADGTQLFIEADDVARFTRRGGQLLAMRGIRIAGIALNPLNPLAPRDGSFDPDEFVVAARQAFPQHVVCDILRPAAGG